jgi:hypothetical protein
MLTYADVCRSGQAHGEDLDARSTLETPAEERKKSGLLGLFGLKSKASAKEGQVYLIYY